MESNQVMCCGAGAAMKRAKRVNTSAALMCTLLLVVGATSVSWATDFYVATRGNDSNTGSLSSPFQTVQRGISSVMAGDTLWISAGTYNEAITLYNSGTKAAPITVKNYHGGTVIINSGNSRAIVLGNTIGYYTFDGLRFVSNYAGVYSGDKNFSLDFGISTSWWGWGAPVDRVTANSGGNNGFTLKNCNIIGSVGFMGSYNTVTNCTFDGKSQFTDAIHDMTVVSHHNTYANNTIHDFVNRGIWSMGNTSYNIISRNTVYNFASGTASDGIGIDLDGAYISDNHILVEHNTIYNGFFGIEFENGSNNIANGNTIYNCARSISLISFGPPIACREYRRSATNSTVMNNLVYNSSHAGIIVVNSPGNQIYNNTIDSTKSRGWAGIFLADGGTNRFPSNGCTIQNNIVSNSAYGVSSLRLQGTITGSLISNNLYFNSNGTAITHNWDNHGTYTLSLVKSALGIESESIYANPMFASGGYNLQGTSPAINMGVEIPVVTTDILGITRPQGRAYDIGAYEYSGKTASPKTDLQMNLVAE